MAEKGFQIRHGEGIIRAVSAGFFFVLVGAILLTVPNLFEAFLAFFKDFKLVNMRGTDVFLPAPANPWRHSAVYSAVMQFCLAWGIFEIAVLALRFVFRSPLGKKAETASNIFFWIGASYLVATFLNESATVTIWFAFWSAIIILVGCTLILKAGILAAAKTRH